MTLRSAALDKKISTAKKRIEDPRGKLRLGIDVQAVDVQAAIAGLCGDYSKLDARLRVLDHSVICDLAGVSLRIHYPAFRGGKPTDDDLTDLLAHYISHFALPRSVRARTYKKFDTLPPEEIELECSRLRAKAVDTFIKAQKATKRNGEAGELMLFLLTEWMLGAPQILAKMSLKTNPDHPVLGADGVHIGYDEESSRLQFYFGESKIHKKLSGAIPSAALSIAKSLQPSSIKYELELVEKNIDLTGLSEAAKAPLLEYLDPWEEQSNTRLDVVTSLIAFDYKGYQTLQATDPDARASEFSAALAEEVKQIAPKVAQIFSKAGLNTESIELFLLPLPSVSVLRERFQARIGWKP